MRFREVIYDYYRRHRRPFPWRKTRNPYHILVSEIMLQQTQTERVLRKYEGFIERFPDFQSLVRAPLQEILSVWQGLGYNRRALALKNIARRVLQDFKGRLPSSAESLMTLPGVGRATASAVAAFAFNKPGVLIETNIRTVFIHFFFNDREGVRDSEIIPLIEKTLDRSNPRRWYYALMDYGVMLKKTGENPGRKSAHHVRQSPFRGSNRQVRGMILKALVEKPDASEKELIKTLGVDPDRVGANLLQLQKEGLVTKRDKRFSIA